MVSPSPRRGRDVRLPLKMQTITPHIGKVLVYAHHHAACLYDDLRFGSKADIEVPSPNVRFTPKSGHRSRRYSFAMSGGCLSVRAAPLRAR